MIREGILLVSSGRAMLSSLTLKERREMKPHVSLNPDPTQLEARIVPLVQFINQLGLPTQYSCEGHGK